VDVLEGWETLTKAKDIYGVIFTGEIDDESLEVDEAATEARRSEIRAAR
jgi:N-methylhydantoinase B